MVRSMLKFMAKCVGLTALLAALAAFGPWASELGRQNPLVGKIYHNGGFAGKDGLFSHIIKARYVLLGEVHDNVDHHRLQAEMIRVMVAAGRRPAVVLEMLPRSFQTRIDAFLASEGANAAGFGKAVDWSQSGWPDWAMYQPIMEAVISAKLKVFAGNVDKVTSRKIAKQGYGALAAIVSWKQWGLGLPLPDDLQARLNDVLQEGHCNMLPKQALPAMSMVQRVRDASMADAMLAANDASGDGAVLIAGGGHVRSEFAVPYYLDQRGAGGQWVSVEFTQVDDETSDPKKSIRKSEKASQAFYLFTPRSDDIDHCAQLRERFGKAKPIDG
jgi:uncharacterized iron-regulated protein